MNCFTDRLLRYWLLAFICSGILYACQSNRQEQPVPVYEESIETTDIPKTQQETDIEIIKDHLATNRIKADRTSSGLYYITEEAGTGEFIEEGDNVKLHAVGKLLDGTQFYSSYEEDQPLETIVGQKMLVPGVEEGLKYFKAAAKGTLYIPSSLGYGAQGFGDQIPPDAILVFDLEILSVE